MTLPRAEEAALLWEGLESVSNPILFSFLNNYGLKVCLSF